MDRPWIEPEEVAPPQEMVEAVGGHPLVAEILAKRGILDPQSALAFLNPEEYNPTPPASLPGLQLAVERINHAIEAGETILVWGDFDVDGQTSTTLLVEALSYLGAEVVYHIPVRAVEGHGIKPEVLRALISPGQPEPNHYPSLAGPGKNAPTQHPELLLTCDTGIAANDAVDLAIELGLDVIITDHHELPGSLPAANVILNPHMLPEGHPLSTLPGVGVAYKLVEGLYQSRSCTEEAVTHLDLVALGIVADVAEQTGDTRYLLQRGLQRLRQNKRKGLAALLRIADISPSSLDESHIGFAIGPRLNALGRLGDANPIVEFFLTRDTQRAEYLAAKLDTLNVERKMLTDRVYRAALDILSTQPELGEYNALVLAQPGWPAGVIGIVASRLVERFGKPTVLLNIDEDGIAHGSARSIEGLNLAKAIEKQSDLLLRFGGHAGAAGLSLEQDLVNEFRSRLSRTVKAMTAHLDLSPTLPLDAVLPLAEMNLDLVEDLNRLGPFGAGNPQLLFASPEIKILSVTRIGRQSEHLRLVVEDREGNVEEILWWRGAEESRPRLGSWFDLAYHASSTSFQGVRELQLNWVDFRISEDIEGSFQEAISPFEIIDYREHSDPLRLLQALQGRQQLQVWAEGAGKMTVAGKTRVQLQASDSLAIWTAPPSFHILTEALDRAIPKTIYVFALLPQVDALVNFLKRLIGLVKTVINRKGGTVSLGLLAAEMAHTKDTVLLGLRRLSTMGMIELDLFENKSGLNPGEDMLRIAWRSDGPEESPQETDKIINRMLSETAAYRNYFRGADLNTILSYRK